MPGQRVCKVFGAADFSNTNIRLALCEIYVLYANLFRKFDLEIHDTTDEDMKWIDLLLT